MAGKKSEHIDIVDLAVRPDITYVANKDPKFVYRHAEDNPLRIAQLRREGFEVVTNSDEEPDPTFAKSDSGTSLPLNLPGHILMRRPRDLHDKIVSARRKRFEDMAKRDEEEAIESLNRDLRKVGGKLKRRMDEVLSH